MSIQSVDWGRCEVLDDRLAKPDGLRFSDEWTLSESWQRAQTEHDRGGPINEAERYVYLDGSETPHRVVWALSGQSLRAHCHCQAYRYHGRCAHLYSLWWRWCTGEIVVSHLDTGRQYRTPPEWLRHEPRRDVDLDVLTPAELDAYLACEQAGVGVREYARHTDRAAGTVGNLLARARDKLGGRA